MNSLSCRVSIYARTCCSILKIYQTLKSCAAFLCGGRTAALHAHGAPRVILRIRAFFLLRIQTIVVLRIQTIVLLQIQTNVLLQIQTNVLHLIVKWSENGGFSLLLSSIPERRASGCLEEGHSQWSSTPFHR